MDSNTAQLLQKLSQSFNSEINTIKNAMGDYSKAIAGQMQGLHERIKALENDTETGCDPTDANLHIVTDPDIPGPAV